MFFFYKSPTRDDTGISISIILISGITVYPNKNKFHTIENIPQC